MSYTSIIKSLSPVSAGYKFQCHDKCYRYWIPQKGYYSLKMSYTISSKACHQYQLATSSSATTNVTGTGSHKKLKMSYTSIIKSLSPVSAGYKFQCQTNVTGTGSHKKDTTALKCPLEFQLCTGRPSVHCWAISAQYCSQMINK